MSESLTPPEPEVTKGPDPSTPPAEEQAAAKEVNPSGDPTAGQAMALRRFAARTPPPPKDGQSFAGGAIFDGRAESSRAKSDEKPSGPGKRYQGTRSRTYQSFALETVQRSGYEPTAGSLRAVRELLGRSRVVGVLSRTGAGEIAQRAVIEDGATEIKLWRAEAKSAVAAGDIRYISEKLEELDSENPRLLWIDTDADPAEETNLLTTLLADGQIESLRTSLDKHNARLVVVFGYSSEREPRYADDRLAAACNGWLYEAPWLDELMEVWKQIPKGREVEQSSGMITRWAKTIAEQRDSIRSEHFLWSVLSDFQNTALEGSVGIGQLDEHFHKALEKAQAPELYPEWTERIRSILGSPPERKILEKTLIVLTALLNTGSRSDRDKDGASENLTYEGLRRFGEELLRHVEVEEGRTRSIEERKTSGDVSVRTRTRAPDSIRAARAWVDRLDHLIRETGLCIKTKDDELRVDFPDTSRRKKVYSLLRHNYPSVVLDLFRQLLRHNWMFHFDPGMRRYVYRCLERMRDFDKAEFMRLGQSALERADELMEGRKSAPEDVTYGISPEEFKDRNHSICLIDFFERYRDANVGPSVINDVLIPLGLWQAREPEEHQIRRILLRTQVCLGMRGFTGVPALGVRIDRSASPLFGCLLKMMREDSDHDTQVLRLEAVSHWLTPPERETDPDTVSRSRLLAEQVWIDTLTEDARIMSREYDPDRSPRTLGRRFVESDPDVVKLWPALMRIGWAQTEVAWFSPYDRLQDMYYLLWVPVADTPARQAMQREGLGETLNELACDVLFRVNGRRQPELNLLVEDPDTAEDLQHLQEYILKARQLSSDDPKTLAASLRAVFSKKNWGESKLAGIVAELSRITHYFASPLRWFPGLLFAHWCFHRTGVEVGAEFRDGEDAVAERRILGSFLDSLTKELADQPKQYGAASLLEQWERLVRVFRGMAAEVLSLGDDELEREGRIELYRLLKHKEKKLMMLKTGLERRIAIPATGA